MQLNRIQKQIFNELFQKSGMEPDDYIKTFSQEYLCKQMDTFSELTEDDADTWITKAYLKSLEG